MYRYLGIDIEILIDVNIDIQIKIIGSMSVIFIIYLLNEREGCYYITVLLRPLLFYLVFYIYDICVCIDLTNEMQFLMAIIVTLGIMLILIDNKYYIAKQWAK